MLRQAMFVCDQDGPVLYASVEGGHIVLSIEGRTLVISPRTMAQLQAIAPLLVESAHDQVRRDPNEVILDLAKSVIAQADDTGEGS